MALKTKVQTEEKNNETKRCRSARRNCSYIQPYFLFEYKWTFKKISATTSVSLCPLKLEKVLQGNLGTDRARECIFRASIAHIFKMLPLNANHGGIFMGSMYVSVCPKKTPDTSLIRDPIILTYPDWAHVPHFSRVDVINLSKARNEVKVAYELRKILMKIDFSSWWQILW